MELPQEVMQIQKVPLALLLPYLPNRSMAAALKFAGALGPAKVRIALPITQDAHTFNKFVNHKSIIPSTVLNASTTALPGKTNTPCSREARTFPTFLELFH